MWGNLRECPFGGRDLTALAGALAGSALAGSALAGSALAASVLAGSALAGTRRKSALAGSRARAHSGNALRAPLRSARQHHEKNVASLTAFALGVWWVQTITVKRPWEGTLYV